MSFSRPPSCSLISGVLSTLSHLRRALHPLLSLTMGKKSKKTNFAPLDLGNRRAQNPDLQRGQVPPIDDVPEEKDFPPLELYEEPKLEGTSIQYYKVGKLKDGVEVGITSLSRSIEVSRATKINIVSFSNIKDMAAQFWTLRDILSGLREIYKRGYYHGMLLEGVAIKNNRANLWNFRCAKPGKVSSSSG